MIIFHEGMPRSGKSYSAIKDHLIPALAKGRKCYVRVDGLNYPKIAELAGRTLDEVRQLMIELSEEQVANWLKNDFDKDAFIFVDEAQNYWPRNRKGLEPEMLKWIAEHGHHGHDVLLMGQLAKDVHTAWINRVNRKLQFIKKDVVGKADEYKWIMFHGSPDASGNVKFREVSKGDAKYEERYFGTYKSHSEGTENKENYVDDRANIFKTAFFRKWLPIYGVIAVCALGYVIYAFKGGLVQDEPKTVKKEEGAKVVKVETRTLPAPAAAPNPPGTPTGASLTQAQQQAKYPGQTHDVIPANQLQPIYQPDYIERLTKSYRIRLGGLIVGAGRTEGVIEWRDEQDGIKESLTLRDIAGFGWLVLITPDGRVGTMQKGDRRYVITQWPLQDTRGTITQAKNDAIKNAGTPAPTEGRADVSREPLAIESGNDSTNPRFNVALRGKD